MRIVAADELLLMSVNEEPGRAVVALCGELDCSNVSMLADTLFGLVAGQAREIVVDVSALRYIDSIGVDALLDATKAAAARQHAVDVVGATGTVLRVFSLLSVDEVLSSARPA